MNGGTAMMARTEIQPAHARRALRTVAVVGGHACPNEIEAVLGAVDHDVVFVQSTGRAYAQMKRAAPDLVIICLGGEDVVGCQLLSMLTLDRDTSRIPVLTFMTSSASAGHDDGYDAAEDMINRFVPCPLN
jgi:CheY-like chemotaxis protein